MSCVPNSNSRSGSACESTSARACWPSRQCAVEITMSGSKQTVDGTPCARNISASAAETPLSSRHWPTSGSAAAIGTAAGASRAGGSARAARARRRSSAARRRRCGAGCGSARVGLEDVARALHELVALRRLVALQVQPHERQVQLRRLLRARREGVGEQRCARATFCCTNSPLRWHASMSTWRACGGATGAGAGAAPPAAAAARAASAAAGTTRSAATSGRAACSRASPPRPSPRAAARAAAPPAPRACRSTSVVWSGCRPRAGARRGPPRRAAPARCPRCGCTREGVGPTA